MTDYLSFLLNHDVWHRKATYGCLLALIVVFSIFLLIDIVSNDVYEENTGKKIYGRHGKDFAICLIALDAIFLIAVFTIKQPDATKIRPTPIEIMDDESIDKFLRDL